MSIEITAHQNHLLGALPDEIWKRWSSELELVHLTLGKVLYEPQAIQSDVYFPTTAIVALMHEIESGGLVETAQVGCEGFVGVSLVLGGDSTIGRAVVQKSGGAVRVRASLLKAACQNSLAVQQLLLRYTQALITHMSQTAICNRHHRIQQQLCKFLLHSLDRQKVSQVAITHEMIGHILGVRREGITEALTQLQRLGLVKCTRGQVFVLDRAGITKIACECYAVVKREFDRLLPMSKVESANVGMSINKATKFGDITDSWRSKPVLRP